MAAPAVSREVEKRIEEEGEAAARRGLRLAGAALGCWEAGWGPGEW